jgi:hypothetical protein
VNSGVFQILVAVAAVIALWAKQRREAARSRSEGPAAPAAGQADAMEEERTRRVQEEIRRKIAQRNAGPEEAPVLAEATPPPPPPVPARPAPAPAPAAVRAVEPAGDWLAELRGTQGARRAMVLREILGPPVGLR